MKSKIRSAVASRRSGGMLLLVGVLAGLAGGGVIASASPKTMTVCANRETNVLAYTKSGTCSTGAMPLVVNQTGEIGPKGDRGATGTKGAKGDTGANGAKGDRGATGATGANGSNGDNGATGPNGASGANGDTGVAGPKGATGVVGAKGATGVVGAKGASGDVGATGAKGDLGAVGVVGAKGASGDVGAKGETGDAGAVWSGGGAIAPVATGENCIATKCTYKIGDTGPGGGTIFFVDYNDVYTSLDYLEAAPMGWGNGITVNQGGLTGETTGSSTVDPTMFWCSKKTTLLGINTLANSAVGAGAINTLTAEAMCEGGAFRAITDYEGGGRTDWFFPSVGETQLMYTNLRIRGLGGFAAAGYWTSTEADATNCYYQAFSFNGRASKGGAGFIRPARAF